ncbi:hypothetical protein [Clostridium tertium]|uniref:Alpha/beta hydrolase family protein n=1 Tax=Clostridium tertium TaxID=1559 RepID=A0A6N3F3T3_9CLOT
MKKLAVIFPGMNYNSDKPLLYYIKKILSKENYDIVSITYGELPKEKQLAFDIAIKKAKEVLKDIDWSDYDTILFVSKSIGTILAGFIALSLPKNIKHIYLTPVNETLQFINGDVLVFSGAEDPMINTENLQEECNSKEIKLYLYDDCNHSMETGDIKKDIQILSVITEKCQEYINSI